MLRFGNDTIKKLFTSLGEDAIENKMITNAITSAQERVEGSNYDSRKSLLDYDDVLRKQREMMYGERDKIIERDDVHEIVAEFFTRVAKKKIMSAKTDSFNKVHFDEDNQPGISNLMSIMSKITNENFERKRIKKAY